jgi:hypothetical protein
MEHILELVIAREYTPTGIEDDAPIDLSNVLGTYFEGRVRQFEAAADRNGWRQGQQKSRVLMFEAYRLLLLWINPNQCNGAIAM